MKLNYINPPTNAAGGAVSGVGTIHISEISSTLTSLSDDLELPFDLNNYKIGSTGKREYSGDLDIVLDDEWWAKDSAADLMYNLMELFGPAAVSRNGTMVHLAYPIRNYDSTKNEIGPRTGKVQVDFYLGNYKWESFFHYSCANSAYKGSHRNLALAAFCAIKDNKPSSELDNYNRPIQERRWKWGPKGLFRVDRFSIMNEKTGKYNKIQKDVNLEGPYTDPASVASILFIDGKETDLHNLESVISATKRSLPIIQQDLVWKRMAKHFNEWSDGKNFYYPPEIATYIDSN